MEFYHRTAELDMLNQSYRQAKTTAKMVVITRRRRVGKTVLALKHVEDKPHLYLFVAKKTENLLCREYAKRIAVTFDYPIIGDINTFRDIFRILLEIAKQQLFVLIIDEFQEFININPAVYSELQEL